MQPLPAARAHLAKAREFLTAADIELSGELYSAATSSAVLAGINAKDAICLVSVGETRKTDNHVAAVRELARSGAVGRSLESTFRRLVAMKTRSQYTAGPISAVDARQAFEWSTQRPERSPDARPGVA